MLLVLGELPWVDTVRSLQTLGASDRISLPLHHRCFEAS